MRLEREAGGKGEGAPLASGGVRLRESRCGEGKEHAETQGLAEAGGVTDGGETAAADARGSILKVVQIFVMIAILHWCSRCFVRVG